MSPLGDLRTATRSAKFVGLTFGFLACLETSLAAAAEGDRQRVIDRWTRRYGRGLLSVFALDVTPRGPHLDAGIPYPGAPAGGERGRIFVMNHRSMLDIFVNLAFIDATFVSRADLAGWPVIGLAARRVGTLFVDRSDKRSGAAVINAMTRALHQARGVLVYPEGTTFEGDEVRPFRPGAFLAAHGAGAEVVPVGIAYDGDDATYVDEPFVAHYRRITSTRRVRIALVAGEPIVPPYGDVDTLRETAHARVQALVHEARRVLEANKR